MLLSRKARYANTVNPTLLKGGWPVSLDTEYPSVPGDELYAREFFLRSSAPH